MNDDVGRIDETSWLYRNVVKRRVTWGYVFAAVFLLFADPTPASVFWGFWLALAGEAVRTWSSGVIVKTDVLATEGPYAMTRNPLYFGSFLIALGVGWMGGRWWFPVLAAAFFLPVYGTLIRKEENRLLERHGDAFREYCRRVPRFWPRLVWPLPRAGYDAARMWRKHKEWQAWLGLYAVTLFLLLRA